MSLDTLYQTIIMEHYKNPRNFGKLQAPTTSVHHENPVCGDHIELQLTIDDAQRIAQIKFYGRGCAISQASASMMTEFVKGRFVSEARAAIRNLKHMLNGEEDDKINLGNLQAFSGVRQFPVRVKCATLAWTALESCLQQAEEK
jgi:nitrogen fixation NifU-like protein